jgi:ABC-type transport system involved in Fe-S cluster assembly fused permease/ATPase subunit
VINEQLLPITFDIIFGTAMLLYYFSTPFALSFFSTFMLYAYFTFRYSDDKRNEDIKVQKNTEKKLNLVLSEAIRNY